MIFFPPKRYPGNCNLIILSNNLFQLILLSTGILILCLQLANLGITVQTAHWLVRQTVKHVDTQMVYVPVRQDGWVIIVQ